MSSRNTNNFNTSFGQSDRLELSRKTGQTGVNTGLNFEATPHFRSPLKIYPTPLVPGKAGTKSLRLFNCPDEKIGTSHEKFNSDQCEKLDSTPNVASAPKLVEFIDLMSSEGTSDSKVTDGDDQSNSQESAMKDRDVREVNSAGCHHSPFKRRVSTKTSAFTFSDDEDSDTSEQPSLKRKNEKLQQSTEVGKEISPKSEPSMKGYMKVGIFFTFCVLLLSIYLHVNPHGFCLDSELSKNISGIENALKAELYGQHIAQKLVTAALKRHFDKHDARKPLVFSFHGQSGTGKNFVSSIIAEHFFKGKTLSPFVHNFIIPFHFPHESEVQSYNKQLLGWIKGNVSHCRKGGLFIFHEMDKIHPGMIGTIKDAILDYRGKGTSAGYKNMVFIFISNSGSQAINDHVYEHVFEGKFRESLTLSELENIFDGIVKHTPDIWFAYLLKSEVIDYLVPFLPLERTHVKQCIRRDLVKKGFHVKEAIVREIADQVDYYPRDYKFFSVSGCKLVSSKVNSIMPI